MLCPTGNQPCWIVWKTHSMQFDVLVLEFSSDHHQTWSTWSHDTEDAKLQRDFVVSLRIYGEKGKQEVCYNVSMHCLICIFKMLWYHLIFTRFASDFTRIMSRPADKNHSMIKNFILVDIDNYHDKFRIFISFKFKGRYLLRDESCRNQTVSCGFKHLLMIRTWQTRHVFKFFTLFQSFFLNKINILIEKIMSYFLHVLMSDIVSNHETGLCCLTLMTRIFSTVCFGLP